MESFDFILNNNKIKQFYKYAADAEDLAVDGHSNHAAIK